MGAAALGVETANTQLGDVITAANVAALPLNGRSYTDLLALQPGVMPVTTITSLTIQGLGQSVFSPSGDLNPGTFPSMARESPPTASWSMAPTRKKTGSMAAAMIPNLDSIAEFRILSDNFDAEYGRIHRRPDQRHHQIRQQRVSRRCFRIPAQHRSRCAQLFLSHARHIHSKPVWRNRRRPHRAQQDLFLLRLSRHPPDSRNRHRTDTSAFAAGPHRQPVRPGEFIGGNV